MLSASSIVLINILKSILNLSEGSVSSKGNFLILIVLGLKLAAGSQDVLPSALADKRNQAVLMQYFLKPEHFFI